MRSNLFMSCIHFIMLSQEDGCCPLEPKQHQLQTHPISGSLQYHSAAHIDTYMRHSTQQPFSPTGFVSKPVWSMSSQPQNTRNLSTPSHSITN